MSEILEQGMIFFFYRPRVGAESVAGLGDVQRFFLVLKPDGRDRYRRLIVGRKSLPDVDAHEREWAFVAEVADDPSQLRDDIEQASYETRTRGVRVLPQARPAGKGRYAIVDHGGHTHLVYALELPAEPGDVQRELNIAREAGYIVAVRNPAGPGPPATGLGERGADFPPELQERFGGRRFIPLDPPEFLDHEGAELVLIAATEDARSELGIDLHPEAERLEDADIFRALRLRARDLPKEPLDTGEWR